MFFHRKSNRNHDCCGGAEITETDFYETKIEDLGLCSLEYTAFTFSVDPDKETNPGMFFLFSGCKYV